MTNYKIEHNKGEKIFFTVIEGLTAYAAYEITEGNLVIYSTFVPKELGGRGIAGALTKECYLYADAQGLTRSATCSYAVAWLEKNN